MKILLRRLHRPLVWVVIYFIFGLIGGTIRDYVSYRSLFFYSLIIVGSNLLIVYYTKRWIYMLFIAVMGMGSLSLFIHPVSRELFKEGEQVALQGVVVDKVGTDFNQAIILNHVSRVEENKEISIRSKVKVISNSQDSFQLGETVLIKGEVKPLSKQYNPSDFDYGLYLKSQGIINEVKLKQVIKRWPYEGILYRVREKLSLKIKYLFKEQDDGLVSALIIGETANLEPDTRRLYEKLGIAHVLAISGLHMSMIAGIVWWLLGFMGLSYEARNRISLIGIWGYSVLVGMGVSVMRASIMLTVMLIVRSLWEEEDLLSSLALSALVILLGNPFQLYQAGFQLSFVAMLGVVLYQQIYGFIKHEWPHTKRMLYAIKIFLPSLCVTLCISPVIAYHFYEVPLLSILLNILLIPLFGIFIPLILVTLLVNLMLPSISLGLAYSILGFLEGIKSIGTFLLTLPFTTLIVGRPSIWSLIVYYSILLIVVFQIKGIGMSRKTYGIGIAGFAVLIGIAGFKTEQFMEISQLYVGQGDCAVITTPKGKVILMDSGPSQSAQKVENYLKYKGKGCIDLAVISHPHEDHIGGLIYLIESGYHVKAVMWHVPDMKEEAYASHLKRLCMEKKIPIYQVSGGYQVIVDGIHMQVLMPYKDSAYYDVNEASLVCLLKYGEFEELFTGDIGFDAEERLKGYLGDLEILKVPHHGSSYSSSSNFLEKLNVEYGMISAGVRNLYGHPHRLALERLEEQQIEVMRTDTQGALFIRTDGKQYTVQSHIQEE